MTLFSQNIDVWDGGAVIWENGAGTQEDPFKIECAEHLAYLAQVINNDGDDAKNIVGKFFILTTDIDIDNKVWVPIGGGKSNPPGFRGIFDGGGHAVWNVCINSPAASNIGLFGCIIDGSISNLTVASGNIVGKLDVGAIVGLVRNSTVMSCRNMGVVEEVFTLLGVL